jgi:hypothetical protein
MDNRRFRCCEQVFAISELVIWKWVGQPVRAAPPDGPLCGSSARPLTASSAPERGTTGDTLTRPRRPACAQRRVGQPAARSDRRAADLRRYLLAGDDLPHLRRYVTPFHAGMPPVSGRGPWRFRPGGPRVSPGVPWRFPRGAVAFPPGCRGVSAGCRGLSAGRRARAAAPSRRRPSLRPPRRGRRRPVPRRAIHSRGGRPRRDGSSNTPADGQPLTSGPARVRLTRRMTRRSRSIAVR